MYCWLINSPASVRDVTELGAMPKIRALKQVTVLFCVGGGATAAGDGSADRSEHPPSPFEMREFG